jgi:hypothetical protein
MSPPQFQLALPSSITHLCGPVRGCYETRRPRLLVSDPFEGSVSRFESNDAGHGRILLYVGLDSGIETSGRDCTPILIDGCWRLWWLPS